MKARVVLLIAIALTCFAGNSLLCRLALAAGAIDAASFTAVRLVSGAVVLSLLALPRKRSGTASWASAAALFGYAAPFSFAYLRLGAALGALILFAFVQITMIGWGVARGERPRASAWLGIALAVTGLVGLTLPGKGAPDLIGAIAMALAGVAWGIFSLRGRAPGDPLLTTTRAFVRAVPFVLALLAFSIPIQGAHLSPRGCLLAIASGALASGCGYSVWYAALKHLTATRAAILQLLVPILATIGAVLFLGETVSLRFAITSIAILGGVALTIR